MERISVIIPTYNRAGLLVEAIDAVKAQSHPIHEIIVVDDGSTDATRAAVDGLSGPIHYMYQTNTGKSAALNNGLRHCSGDYIWICDDDDLVLPEAAKLLVSALAANGAAGFAFGRFKQFAVDRASGKRKLFEPVYWPDLNSNSLLVSLLEDCFIFQNGCLVRREVFEAVGPFRTELIRSQDYEMTIRLARQFAAAYVPEVLFLQRKHEGLRGGARERFDTSKQMEKWLQYDAIFFRELYKEIPLCEFVPKSMAASEPGASQRAALLQRACIFWRRKLFEYSLRDMFGAVEMGALNSLHPSEELICGRFLDPKFGCEELTKNPEITRDLLSLAAKNDFGMSVARAVTAPLLWYIRRALTHGNWQKALTLGMVLLRIHGCSGTIRVVRSSLARRLKLPKALHGYP